MQIKDALQFVLDNREGTSAFRCMSAASVLKEIVECGKDNGVAHTKEKGKITGLVTFELVHEYEIMYVHNLLCTTTDSVISMCCMFDQYFRGWDIQAYRGYDADNLVRYKNTRRLIRLLAKISLRNNTRKQLLTLV